jgi:hypothetical protein
LAFVQKSNFATEPSLVLKPLLDGRELTRLNLYRRHIILERLKSLPLLLHVSPEIIKRL